MINNGKLNINHKEFMLIINKISFIKIIPPLVFLILFSIFFFIPITIAKFGV